MNPARVLHLFGRMARGGAELRTLELMRHLETSRYQFEFCALSGQPGELDADIRALGGAVHLLGLGPYFPMRFGRLLRAGGYRAVHSHVHYFSGYILRAAHAAGIPIRIAHFRSTQDGRAPSLRRRIQNRWMRRWIDRYATHILGVSHSALTHAWRRNWEDDPRCSVVYNAIDAAAFERVRDIGGVRGELGVPADGVFCIHVGRMDPAKNHIRLLRIFRAVCERCSDMFLVLVGGGEGETAVRGMVRAAGLERRILFTGVRTDIPRLLSAADLMVFPSLREGLPGAVLEAAAAGTPVIASDIPATVEISAYLPFIQCLDLNAPDADWTGAIERCAGNRHQHRRSEAASLFRSSPFTLQQALPRWEHIYAR